MLEIGRRRLWYDLLWADSCSYGILTCYFFGTWVLIERVQNNNVSSKKSKTIFSSKIVKKYLARCSWYTA